VSVQRAAANLVSLPDTGSGRQACLGRTRKGASKNFPQPCLPVPAAGQLCLERGMTWRIAIGTCGVTGTNFCSGDVEETGWLG